MRLLTRARAPAEPVDLLAVTFELNHLDADLHWIEESGRRLPDLSGTRRPSTTEREEP